MKIEDKKHDQLAEIHHSVSAYIKPCREIAAWIPKAPNSSLYFHVEIAIYQTEKGYNNSVSYYVDLYYSGKKDARPQDVHYYTEKEAITNAIKTLEEFKKHNLPSPFCSLLKEIKTYLEIPMSTLF